MTKISPRQQAQDELVAFLEGGIALWTAPYGICSGLEPFGVGKKRVIAFGISGTLDACLEILDPKRITLSANGRLAYDLDGQTFTSTDECIKFLSKWAYLTLQFNQYKS